MKELSYNEMMNLEGGIDAGCWLAYGGYAIAAVSVCVATGGVGVFLLAQAGLYVAAASIAVSCG